MSKPLLSRSETERRDVAACMAMAVLMGDEPQPPHIALMEEFGYWYNGDLTEDGVNAGADASGHAE